MGTQLSINNVLVSQYFFRLSISFDLILAFGFFRKDKIKELCGITAWISLRFMSSVYIEWHHYQWKVVIISFPFYTLSKIFFFLRSLTSSRRMASSWNLRLNSSHSSLYFSISSFVCLIFFLRTSRSVPCCNCVVIFKQWVTR